MQKATRLIRQWQYVKDDQELNTIELLNILCDIFIKQLKALKENFSTMINFTVLLLSICRCISLVCSRIDCAKFQYVYNAHQLPNDFIAQFTHARRLVHCSHTQAHRASHTSTRAAMSPTFPVMARRKVSKILVDSCFGSRREICPKMAMLFW